MKKISFLLIISILVLTGCSQHEEPATKAEPTINSTPDKYVGKINSSSSDRNNYVKQYCIDQKVDNIWYVYIDDQIESETYENYGWKNTVNDEIMVPAKYSMIFKKCFDNTSMKGFTAFTSEGKGLWYTKPNGEKIIQAFLFDNGPDYFKEGLSRYLDNGKVGYMNENLEIIISAQFDSAWYFENGVAKVCNGCKKVYYGEHYKLEGGIWGTTDKNGNITWDK